MSDDRTKYRTTKYGPTVECPAKYDVTVNDACANMCKSILVVVRRSLSSSQLPQQIHWQDLANLNNGSSIKTKRGSTWRNLRSSNQCAILKEFRRDRCDFSEKALACSTHAADCGLSASSG